MTKSCTENDTRHAPRCDIIFHIYCGWDIERIYDSRALRDAIYKTIQPLRAMLTPSIPGDGQNCIIYHTSYEKRDFYAAPPSFLLLSCHFYWFDIWMRGRFDDTLLPYCVRRGEAQKSKFIQATTKKSRTEKWFITMCHISHVRSVWDGGKFVER